MVGHISDLTWWMWYFRGRNFSERNFVISQFFAKVVVKVGHCEKLWNIQFVKDYSVKIF